MDNIEIVDKGGPLGIVGTVRANEPNQVRAIDGHLDELITRRSPTRSRHTWPFLGQTSSRNPS